MLDTYVIMFEVSTENASTKLPNIRDDKARTIQHPSGNGVSNAYLVPSSVQVMKRRDFGSLIILIQSYEISGPQR